jgi:hypothetical protein
MKLGPWTIRNKDASSYPDVTSLSLAAVSTLAFFPRAQPDLPPVACCGSSVYGKRVLAIPPSQHHGVPGHTPR